MSNSVQGTQFEVNIYMKPIEGYHLSGLEWSADIGTYTLDGKVQTFPKASATKVDDDNYTVIVDSTIGGPGAYWLTLTVYIPNSAAPNGTRREIVTVFTGVMIDKPK